MATRKPSNKTIFKKAIKEPLTSPWVPGKLIGQHHLDEYTTFSFYCDHMPGETAQTTAAALRAKMNEAEKHDESCSEYSSLTAFELCHEAYNTESRYDTEVQILDCMFKVVVSSSACPTVPIGYVTFHTETGYDRYFTVEIGEVWLVPGARLSGLGNALANVVATTTFTVLKALDSRLGAAGLNSDKQVKIEWKVSADVCSKSGERFVDSVFDFLEGYLGPGVHADILFPHLRFSEGFVDA